MMSAAEIEKGMEALNRTIEWAKKDRELELDMLRREFKLDSEYLNMDTVIAYANRIKSIDIEIEKAQAKLRLCKEILDE